MALRGVSEEIYRRVREINPYSQKILYTIFFNHSPRRYRSSVSLIWLRNTGDVSKFKQDSTVPRNVRNMFIDKRLIAKIQVFPLRIFY